MLWICYFSYFSVHPRADRYQTESHQLNVLYVYVCSYNLVSKYFQRLETLKANDPPSLSQTEVGVISVA